MEILKAWREKSRRLEYLPPVEVASGPVTENVVEGEDIDLEKFPAPKWHELDGGRYIGTADMVITRDPKSCWINVGAYRACIQGKRRLSLWVLEHHHGKQIIRRHCDQGRRERIRLRRRLARRSGRGDQGTAHRTAGAGICGDRARRRDSTVKKKVRARRAVR